MPLVEELLQHPAVTRSPVARELAVVMTRPTGRTSAGYPYLQASAWARFRDWVPHILAWGPRVLDAAREVEVLAAQLGGDDARTVPEAAAVVRQVVFTAAVTAPSDLWLLRWVLGALGRTGLSRTILAGDVVHPEWDGFAARELAVDFRFLLARGYLLRSGPGYRIAPTRHSRRVFAELEAWPELPADLAAVWARWFRGDASADDTRLLDRAAAKLPGDSHRDLGVWSATPEEIEIGFRLVPLLVGLQASGRIPELVAGGSAGEGEVGAAAAPILRAAGVVDAAGRIGEVGRRVLERGPGPMGIIEAYHPYMARLADILTSERGDVWVRRSANVAASQLANQRSFRAANDALDRFTEATGFRYPVFIEHAMGRGEATRQRYERSGDAEIAYVGADLEAAAINAALEEQAAGRLPASMRFVRGADIGRPELLLDALAGFGLSPEGAVMMVGNGFHEVRDPSDEAMTRVFESYREAGIVLLFTEETALSVEDLLETAWNTYHAGFKYVHERSGQGLRPASWAPPTALEGTPRASWTECAERAGYVRAEEYCVRSRTVYPYPPASGHNPPISVTHFFVPAPLAERLGLRDGRT